MSKLLNEIQIHMRLKVSANTTQIRQHYLPTLFPKLIEPLMAKDSGAVSASTALLEKKRKGKAKRTDEIAFGFGFDRTRSLP